MTDDTVLIKTVDSENNAVISALAEDTNQDIYFRGWVTVQRKSHPKERIIVITNFRIYILKKCKIHAEYPIYGLTSFGVEENDHTKLELKWGDEQYLCLVHKKFMGVIVRSIMFAYDSITSGRDEHECMTFYLPDALLDTYEAPEMDRYDEVLSTYLAECDMLQVSPSVKVLDYIMASFWTNDGVFDGGYCFNDKNHWKDIAAVCGAIRYTKWFKELYFSDVTIKKEGLEAIGSIFSGGCAVQGLTLAKNKVSKIGPLAKSLSLVEQYSLKHLNLRDNSIGDSGVELLMENIQRKPLRSLILRNCGFEKKGFKIICATLANLNWCAELNVLDLSNNRGGKSGTKALVEWQKTSSKRALASDVALKELYLSACDLDLDPLFKALCEVMSKGNSNICTLSFSGNKMSRSSESSLSILLTKATGLATLAVSRCSMKASTVVALLHAVQGREQGCLLSLNFSDNDLGKKGAKHIADFFSGPLSRKKRQTGVRCLDLSDNNLMVQGVEAIAHSLRLKDIDTLILDRNWKRGKNASDKYEFHEVAQLIAINPSLQSLSLDGGRGMRIGKSFAPIFVALCRNCTLSCLSIAHNRISQGCHVKLIKMIEQNESITALDVNDNKISLGQLQNLVKALHNNSTLLHLPIPVHDLRRLSNQKSTLETLVQFANNIDICLERNREGKIESESTKPKVPCDLDKQSLDEMPDLFQRRQISKSMLGSSSMANVRDLFDLTIMEAKISHEPHLEDIFDDESRIGPDDKDDENEPEFSYVHQRESSVGPPSDEEFPPPGRSSLSIGPFNNHGEKDDESELEHAHRGSSVGPPSDEDVPPPGRSSLSEAKPPSEDEDKPLLAEEIAESPVPATMQPTPAT